jgi:sugar lactone lactonase YvrE
MKRAFLTVLLAVCLNVAPASGGEGAGIIDSCYGLPPDGDGRPGRVAILEGPLGLAVGGDGNVYVADVSQGRVRRYDVANDLVTTVVGTGESGGPFEGVPGTRANLPNTFGVAIDAYGNLFVLDGSLSRVLRVDAVTGICTTYAGNGEFGFSGDGGPATSAAIYATGIAIDRDGSLFILDGFNARVRRVDAATGIIETFAGGGAGGDGGLAVDASLPSVGSVAVDSRGNVFIAANVVRRVDAVTKRISTYAGGGNSVAEGVAATDAYLATGSLAVDANDNLYVVDNSTRIRRIDRSSQRVVTVAGTGAIGYSGDGGSALGAELLAHELAVDAQGNLYFSDPAHAVLRRVDLGAGVIDTVVGRGNDDYDLGDGGPAANARFFLPTGLAWDANGDLLVADRLNHRVRKVAVSTGIATTIAGNGSSDVGGDGTPAVEAGLGEPGQVAADRNGNVYVLLFNRVVRWVDAQGTVRTLLADGRYPALVSARYSPSAIAVDSRGRLLFATPSGHVRRYDPVSGAISLVAGNGNRGGSGDGGPATEAELDIPEALVLDGADNLYVVETRKCRIRRVDAASGVIRTVVGRAGRGFSGDGGPASQAQLNFPTGVAVDDLGNLFICDSWNHRIRRIDAATGIITTIAGDGTAAFIGDGGPAVSATFRFPHTVLVTPDGSLLISDAENNVVRCIAGVAVGSNRPVVVEAAGYAGKTLTIAGQGFGLDRPIVSINGLAITVRVLNQSDAEIRLKGSARKLNLRPGENVLVVTRRGVASEPFTFSYAGVAP